MEQFSLEKYLENPSRKITTRYSDREVRIICTDRKAKLPIVALMVDMDGNEYVTYHTKNGWCSAEEKYPDKRDLFFADEEEPEKSLRMSKKEALQQYEYEKRLFEQWGGTSIITFKEWLEIKSIVLADDEEELTEFESKLYSTFSEIWQDYMLGREIDVAEVVKEYSPELLDLARKELQPEFDKEMDKMLAETDKVVYQKGQQDVLESLPKWKKAEKDEELDCHVAIQQDGRVVLSDFVQKDEYYITLDVLKTLPKEE